MNTTLQSTLCFPSPIYTIDKPEFLEPINEIAQTYLDNQKAIQEFDPLYPMCMTQHIFNEPNASEFASFVSNAAWKILEAQGYAMENLETVFSGMWVQEHYKMSGMDQHVHGYGDQIVGFYFLECPDNCSKILLHDPRAAKVQINLPEKDPTVLTEGSGIVNFDPVPGQLMFINSWLPHSFSKHNNEFPFRFVHFNLSVRPVNTAIVV